MDGRTIKPDAFKHEDGKRLPLLWRHDDETPTNVLGYAVLEHRDGDGVYAKAYFNNTETGRHAKETVEHGDLDGLSIKAVRLKQNGLDVIHGDLLEVSLVPAGANEAAKIDQVFLQHGDYINEMENQGYITSGTPLELAHADDDDEEKEEPSEEDDSDEEDSEDESSGASAKSIYESLNEDQKALVDILIQEAGKGGKIEQEDTTEDSLNHEGDNQMKTRNVFDKTEAPTKEALTHDQMTAIIESAKKTGSLKDAVLEHAQAYGITNIEDLFPEPKKVTDRPEWIKRDDSWVAGVLSGVKSSPFSRIKSMSADITHEEARARGYIKGDLKKDQFFAVAGRTTTPKTIYKRQKLDRDDIIDVTDFDVVAWIKEEMRWMLQEELARAILFGDNRPVEDPANVGQPNPDKINEENIRPVATDDDFYTAKINISPGMAAKDLAKRILRARKLIKGGTGKPTLYTNDDLVIDMLLMEDKLGRRYYDTETSLAAALGVKNIVVVEILDDGAYTNEDGDILVGVLVNINDYTVGADKGGQVALFDDFDIDYNQYKYLIETRRSGALTKHRSAISIWESAGIEAMPLEPVRDDNAIDIPNITGVEYWYYTGTDEPVKATNGATLTIEEGETLYVEARPAAGYRFPFNVDSDWSFTFQD